MVCTFEVCTFHFRSRSHPLVVVENNYHTSAQTGTSFNAVTFDYRNDALWGWNHATKTIEKWRNSSFAPTGSSKNPFDYLNIETLPSVVGTNE